MQYAQYSNYLSIVAAAVLGFDLGLLTGLSVSPVVGTVVTGILALFGLAQKWNPLAQNKSDHSTAKQDHPENTGPIPASVDAEIANATRAPTQDSGNLNVGATVLLPLHVLQASWVIVCGIFLIAGLFLGMNIRTSTTEQPKRNLHEYYTAMGFDTEQVKSIVENEASALAGKFRNLRSDCLDIGLSQDQAQAVINNIAAKADWKAKRYTTSQEQNIETSNSPKPDKPEVSKDPHEDRPEKATKAPSIDPRGAHVFHSDTVSWISALLNEIKAAEGRAINDSPQNKLAMEMYTCAIRHCEKAVSETAEITANKFGKDNKAYDYYVKLANYLQQLNKSSNGATWSERIDALSNEKESIVQLYKEISSREESH